MVFWDSSGGFLPISLRDEISLRGLSGIQQWVTQKAIGKQGVLY